MKHYENLRKMINLLKKLLARFGFQLVFKEEPHKEEPHKEERCFLKDITSPEFIQKHPDFLDRYVEGQKNKSLYVGDINYLEDKDRRTYYEEQHYGTNKKYFNFDGERYAPEELAEKLNDR